MGKVLIAIGIIFLVAGILVVYKISIPGLGKLSGDISIRGDGYQIYFPVMTCLILSLLLSLILYLISRFHL